MARNAGMNIKSEQLLPDRPRLRNGCSIFEYKGNLVVRGTTGSYQVASSHRAAMHRVLSRLDGSHDFEGILGGETTADAFYALRLLASLSESKLLMDGPEQRKTCLTCDGDRKLLRDRTFICLDSGCLSTAITNCLSTLGANVVCGNLQDAVRMGGIGIVCLDDTDLVSVEAINQEALRVGATWLVTIPFGDCIVTSPVFVPPRPPCFRCFELRWLSISPSIELECAYFSCMRIPGFFGNGMTTSTAELMAPQLVKMLINPDLSRHVGLTSLEEGTTETALLLPFPSCEVCKIKSKAQDIADLAPVDWLDPPLSLSEIGTQLETLVRQPCGLVWVSPLLKKTNIGQEFFTVAVTRFAMPEPETVEGKLVNWCHGAASSPEDARTIAVIEALERYSALSKPARGVIGPYSALAPKAILPTELPLFSDAQYRQEGFPYQPFDPDMTLHWNYGYNLTSDRQVLVPTSAAWYGYHDNLLGECSSGVAAHSSRGHALLNAVLELVERDAFMIHWLHRLSPPRIKIDTIQSQWCHAVIDQVSRIGYQIQVLDMTTDLRIPVIVSIAYRTDHLRPALILGAGSSLNPRQALRRALTELYAATFAPTNLWRCKPPLELTEVQNLSDHSRAYEHPAWLKHAEFLWQSPRYVCAEERYDELAWDEQLKDVVDKLALNGHDVIGVDLTAPEIAPTGLHVVRAIVPGLQPLGLNTGGRLGGCRLFQSPVRMGYHPKSSDEIHLYRIPHCFP